MTQPLSDEDIEREIERAINRGIGIAGPYYHGTQPSDARNLIENGIREAALQRRDGGYFGAGFYVTNRRDTARNYGKVVVEVQMGDDADVLFAGETFQWSGEGGATLSRPVPQSNPSWHDAFIEWELDRVRDAAVWEWADTTKETVLERAENENTPESGDFNRLDWYGNVTEWARWQGYDVVYWSAGEIVIIDYNSPADIVHVSGDLDAENTYV